MGELGDLLHKARADKDLTLGQVEEQIRIRSKFLQALEEEDYDQLPAPVYVKGFLRNYATYLGLDPQEVLSLYQQPEMAEPATAPPAMLDEPLEPVSARQLWPLLLVAVAMIVVS